MKTMNPWEVTEINRTPKIIFSGRGAKKMTAAKSNFCFTRDTPCQEGRAVVWLHGHGGSPGDRMWFLEGLPLHQCHVMELSGGAQPWLQRGRQGWFQYAEQWAADGSGQPPKKAV